MVNSVPPDATMKPKPAVTDSGFGKYTFLRTGAAGAFLTTAKRASAELPSDALNIALVGCGVMGETILRVTRSDLVPVRWVAFCDILESKSKSFGNKLNHLREANIQSWSYRHLESMLKEHPEIDAVFIPRPNLPRSFSSLSSVGVLLPKRIASINSALVIPMPSSIMATHGTPLFQRNRTEIVVDLAVMLLSTMSARAVSKV